MNDLNDPIRGGDLTINSAALNENYLANPTGKELNFITRPVERIRAELRNTPMGADKVMLYASLSCLSLVALSVPIFLVAWMALPKDASSGLMIPIRLLLGLGISIVGLGVFTVGLAGMPIGWLFGKAYEGIKALKNRNK